MTDLNPDKLREMAGKIQALLDEFEIDGKLFTVKIRVPREYLQAINKNFPESPLRDVVVYESDPKWSIMLTTVWK